MAMLAFNVEIRVFSTPEESEQILKAISRFLPPDLEKEKIRINQTTAEGFGDRKIRIYTVTLTRQRHVTKFLDNLSKLLSSGQKSRIIEEFDSRTDPDFNFYIRLDREMFLRERVELTDTGSCFWIRISLALFPRKRETAIETVKRIFKMDGSGFEPEASP